MWYFGVGAAGTRYERRRRLLTVLPLLLALVGLCSRFVGEATADSVETSVDSEYRVAQASISASVYQQCGITIAGGVQCWGYGPGGRLGDGTETSSDAPVDVVGLSTGVTSVVAGSDTTCALTAVGGAKCWGARVGDGSISGFSTSAVDVSQMTQGVRQIDIGGGFTCFVTTSSDVRCLGDNSWAQLGDGTRTSTDTVSSVVSALAGNVRSISTMGQATCAILLDATVKCWGYGGYGQLGDGGYGIDGNNPYTLQPVAVTGLSSVVALAGGDRSMCALTAAGGVKCWGDNQFGQLGNGTAISSPTPVDVVGLGSGVRTITSGGLTTCALLTSNEVKCWGRNSEAELGLGATGGSVNTPTTVPGLSGTITAVTAGYYNVCALNSIGELRCWGLVAGMATPTLSPTVVANFDGVHTRIIDPDAVVLLRDFYPTDFMTIPGVDNPVNLGVRVTTSAEGTITKVLFAKDPTNTDEHIAVVWDAAGVVLASQTFTGESSQGWQEVTLTTPVVVAAGDTFTVGYSLRHTGYAYGPTFPSSTVGPLTISTGYYVYSSNPTDFPSGSVGSNYGIDFEFITGGSSTTTSTSTSSTSTSSTSTTSSTTSTSTTTTSSTTSTTLPVTTSSTSTTSTTSTTSSSTSTTSTSTTTTVPATSTTVVVPTGTTTAPTTSSPATSTTAPPTSAPPTSDAGPTTSTPTTSPAPDPAPISPDEQVQLVASLESNDVTPTQVVEAVANLIDAGISGDAATELATSEKVLESIDTTQAQAVFEAIPVDELTPQQVEALASTLTDAPTDIKDTFEATIDVYGDGFDTYVPVDSLIDVGDRKTLVAAMAAVTSIAAAAATAGASGAATGGTSSVSGRSRDRSG